MTTPIACAACGTLGSGRFCTGCGAMLGGHSCTECGTPMSPGARFCHRCGASSSGNAIVPGRSTDAAVPWAVAAIAMVALIALVAGRQFSGNGKEPEATPLSAASSERVVRAPDISGMTPAERAEALYDRIVRLGEAGEVDSVRFFAPMAIASYQMIDSLTDDQRFDLGRIGILAGQSVVARAQADTLLSRNPNHLLGLTLALTAAQADRDADTDRSLKARLLAASGDSRLGQAISQRHRSQVADAVKRAQQAQSP